MEAKLTAHRAEKRRLELYNKYKTLFLSMLPFQSHTIDIDKKDDDNKLEKEKLERLHESSSDEDTGIEVVESGEDGEGLLWTSEEEEAIVDEPNKSDDSSSNLKYFTWFIYFCFWATCYMIAIELKFGTVYLLFSALFGIYFNTGTGPRPKNEVSAYSVFNKNCEAIDGTLKPEQFEREIRYGPTSVR